MMRGNNVREKQTSERDPNERDETAFKLLEEELFELRVVLTYALINAADEEEEEIYEEALKLLDLFS